MKKLFNLLILLSVVCCGIEGDPIPPKPTNNTKDITQ